MKPTLPLVLVLIGSFLLASSSQARVLRVPSVVATIPAAIDSAAAGDTILVAPGTYYVNLDAGQRFLTFLSEAGAEGTVLDGGRLDSVVKLPGSGVIDGFTIRNGLAMYGGGVMIGNYEGPWAPEGTIRNCTIENCVAGYYDHGDGGGIFVDVQIDLVTIDQCTIQDNYAGLNGGGIMADGDVVLRRSSVLRNGCHMSGGATQFVGIVEQCVITGNWSDYGTGGICEAGRVERSTIVGNFSHNSVHISGAIELTTGHPVVRNNIVAFNHGPPGWHNGVGIYTYVGGTFDCNDSYGNDGGDYSWDVTGSTNMSKDPLFCDFDTADYGLRSDSPCLADSTGCGLIGALDVGCVPTLATSTTWGALKAKGWK
jgi:hypothetical protein